MLLKCAYINILETSTVSLVGATEDPPYNLYRLYDRGLSIFKTTAAVTMDIKVVQPVGGILAIDCMFIPAGHNLSTVNLKLQYSDDNAVWFDAPDPWMQIGNGQIEKNWSGDGAEAREHWKLVITSPPSIPQIPELSLTSTYTWERPPSQPGGPFDDRPNVHVIDLSGGRVNTLSDGPQQKRRSYHMSGASETQKDSILALWAAVTVENAFWLCDENGVWIFGRLLKPLDIRETAYQTYSFEFDFGSSPK